MELQKAIEERHSCRTYLPTPISNEIIEQIVDAGRLAPSAKNAQPWKFVAIKTDKKAAHISDILKKYYIDNKDSANAKGASSVYATANIMKDCPVGIFIFTDSEDIDRDKIESISDILSIGAAVEHMMLKATDLGLGCLWVCDTYYVHKEISEFMESLVKDIRTDFLQEKNRLISVMLLGEKAEPRYVTPRKQLKEILTIVNEDN